MGWDGMGWEGMGWDGMACELLRQVGLRAPAIGREPLLRELAEWMFKWTARQQHQRDLVGVQHELELAVGLVVDQAEEEAVELRWSHRRPIDPQLTHGPRLFVCVRYGMRARVCLREEECVALGRTATHLRLRVRVLGLKATTGTYFLQRGERPVLALVEPLRLHFLRTLRHAKPAVHAGVDGSKCT
jgi:hypothetical protein